MPQYVYVYVFHTHLYNWSAPSGYSSIAAFHGCYSELTSYAALAFTDWVSFMRHINAKAMPIKRMDCSCHTTAVENQSYGVYTTPLFDTTLWH